MDRNNEPISALVDGEIDRRGADFLIRRLADDEEMQRVWQRFHSQRACLQREFVGPVALVDRVRSALAGEEAPTAGRLSGLTMMRAGIGGAVAAGVALVAVIGLGNRMALDRAEPDPAGQPPAFVSQTTALDRQFSQQAVPVSLGTARAESETDRSTPVRSRQRINRYMIRHSQAAGASGFVSFMPVLTAPSTVPVYRPAADQDEPAHDNPDE
ncbi:MAG: sigma-E factor negative regulatory protein [Wenzhouxiangellaceae bacterium]|nr:sigma-E factor negative regulatory protein [Wenzhouxiangellaceae bacterium]